MTKNHDIDFSPSYIVNERQILEKYGFIKCFRRLLKEGILEILLSGQPSSVHSQRHLSHPRFRGPKTRQLTVFPRREENEPQGPVFMEVGDSRKVR